MSDILYVQFTPEFAQKLIAEVFVFTLNGGRGKWSRYIFPFQVDGFAQLGNDLYIRSGDVVRRVNPELNYDDMTLQGGSANLVNFPGIVQWPWLNMGDSGRNKVMRGFDYTGSGQAPSISIGYDQRNLTLFTTPYMLNDDTLTGGFVPLEVTGPTFSIRMDFSGGSAWGSNQVLIYTDPTRAEP